MLRYLLLGVLSLLPLNEGFGAEAEPIRVFVSIPPQAYFVQRVGGDRVEVEVLLRPGQSPATFDPTPKQIDRLAQADIWFQIGVPFERSLGPRVAFSLPNLEVAQTQEGVTFRSLSRSGKSENRDPHIWLDPDLVKIQAKNICHALSASNPDHATEYSENLFRFEEDLDSLAKEISSILEPVRGKDLPVFHPAFGYFADRFGLKQVAIEVEGKQPGIKQLQEWIDKARAEGIQVLFVQSEFSTKAVEVIAAAIPARVVVLDPLAGDYMKNIRRMARTIVEALIPPADAVAANPLPLQE